MKYLLATTFSIYLCSICAPRMLKAVSFDTVPVGNSGNVGQGSGTGVNGSAADGGTPYTGIGTFGVVGAVNYEYQIGAFEVTNSQYAEFLRAKAVSDPYGLYNSSMGSDIHGGIVQTGASGSFDYTVKSGAADDPVNFVSYFDAIRFVNWANNGQGSGDTETGSYTLLGGTATPSNSSTVARNPNAIWVLPTEDEWYKAAYYDPRTAAQGGPPGDDHYWLYATKSDSEPTIAIVDANGEISNPGINVANWGHLPADDALSSVGSAGPLSASYYGTFDQAGNVWEWNETLMGSNRGFRGGSFHEASHRMRAYVRAAQPTTAGGANYGFRVAVVPEPSTALLAAAAFGMMFFTRRQLCKRGGY